MILMFESVDYKFFLSGVHLKYGFGISIGIDYLPIIEVHWGH